MAFLRTRRSEAENRGNRPLTEGEGWFYHRSSKAARICQVTNECRANFFNDGGFKKEILDG
jgi:hypothetical protein